MMVVAKIHGDDGTGRVKVSKPERLFNGGGWQGILLVLECFPPATSNDPMMASPGLGLPAHPGSNRLPLLGVPILVRHRHPLREARGHRAVLVVAENERSAHRRDRDGKK